MVIVGDRGNSALTTVALASMAMVKLPSIPDAGKKRETVLWADTVLRRARAVSLEIILMG